MSEKQLLSYDHRNEFHYTDISLVISHINDNPMDIVNASESYRLFEYLISKTYFTGDPKNMNAFLCDGTRAMHVTHVYILENSKPVKYTIEDISYAMFHCVKKILSSPDIKYNLLAKVDLSVFDDSLMGCRPGNCGEKVFDDYIVNIVKDLFIYKGSYDKLYNREYIEKFGSYFFDEEKKREDGNVDARKLLQEARSRKKYALNSLQEAEEKIAASLTLLGEEGLVEDHVETANKPSLTRKHITPAFRLIVAYTQEYKCNSCHKILEPGWHIDHKKPLWKGGTDTEDNLQALCQLCHLRKTSQETQVRSGRRVEDVFPFEVEVKNTQEDTLKLLHKTLINIEQLLAKQSM